MNIIDCKSVAQKWKDDIKRSNIHPTLCVIQVTGDTASDAYVKGKKKDAEEVGFGFEHILIQPKSKEQVMEEVIRSIKRANTIEDIRGIIVQLPLPFGIGAEDICPYINPEKDVDGFLPNSLFKPCTPDGIIHLMDEYNVRIDGKSAVVIGRSDIVGKPMAQMLLDRNATVVQCHSHTPNNMLKDLVSKADIVVCAVGKAGFLSAIDFKQGAFVADVGINRVNGKLCGDIDISVDNDICITPVPGGIGLLTRAMLMRHMTWDF